VDALRIVVQTPSANAHDWHAAVAAALPEADVGVWPAMPRRGGLSPQPSAAGGRGSREAAGEGSLAIDYALVWKPPADLLAALAAQHPRSKAIFNLGAGVDALLAMPALPADVPVVRLEDTGMAVQMVEYVTLAVLTEFREQARYEEAQRAARWEPRPRRRKAEFGIGLLGLGVLGTVVAAALAPLGFPLFGWGRTKKALPHVHTYAGDAELLEFLAQEHVLVCLLPSTSATRDLLNHQRLSALPRGASLVNVARGDIVVDADLIALLDAGHLAHATLDVFRAEPLPPAHPFWHHPRVTVTPHVSAMTLVDESVAQIAAKIRRLERGLPVTGVVDRTRGY